MTNLAEHLVPIVAAAREDLARALSREGEDAADVAPMTGGVPSGIPAIRSDHGKRNTLGANWFAADACAFFGTQFEPATWQVPGATLFVTTEQPPSGPRRASVRAYLHASAQVRTLGPFAEMTAADARAVARELAAPAPPVMHYAMSREEYAAALGPGRYVSQEKYATSGRALKPEMICRTGDGHAVGLHRWEGVNCPACLAKRPS